jgi:hypothetical protein
LIFIFTPWTLDRSAAARHIRAATDPRSLGAAAGGQDGATTVIPEDTRRALPGNPGNSKVRPTAGGDRVLGYNLGGSTDGELWSTG